MRVRPWASTGGHLGPPGPAARRSIAHDSHNVEDLAAEELAMHYEEDESAAGLGNDDLPENLRSALAE